MGGPWRSARPTTSEPVSAHPECLEGECPSAGTVHEARRAPYRICRASVRSSSPIQAASPLPSCASRPVHMSRRDPILPRRTLAKPREAIRHMQLQRPRVAVRTRVSSSRIGSWVKKCGETGDDCDNRQEQHRGRIDKQIQDGHYSGDGQSWSNERRVRLKPVAHPVADLRDVGRSREESDKYSKPLRHGMKRPICYATTIAKHACARMKNRSQIIATTRPVCFGASVGSRRSGIPVRATPKSGGHKPSRRMRMRLSPR